MNARMIKHDSTIMVTIRGIETRHSNIEEAEYHYMIEAEGAKATVRYSDGSVEIWRH